MSASKRKFEDVVERDERMKECAGEMFRVLKMVSGTDLPHQVLRAVDDVIRKVERT